MPIKMKKGKVFLVGAGPGDPGLITQRGADCVDRAEVIVLDALVNPALVRHTRASVIYVGKRGPGAPAGSSKEVSQKKINQLLVRLAHQGKRVVRLKGGDPLVFGRGSEEMEALKKAKIPFEVVPGVTSAIAGPAYAGIPISDRRWASQVTFLTGQESDDSSKESAVDWDRLSTRQTLVILMGVSRWPKIQKKLLDRGWPSHTPVAAIESATTAAQRVLLSRLDESISHFRKNKLMAPSILVVGKVASLSKTLAWVQKEKPLLGKKVVITRAEAQSATLGHLFEETGAQVLYFPTIQISPIRDNPNLHKAYKDIRLGRVSYDWTVFLSVNGVRTFAQGVGAGKINLHPSRLCAVGPQTKKAVEALGWTVHRQAQTYNSKGVLAALGSIKGKRILVVRVEGGPQDFVQACLKKGAQVKELATYRNSPAPEASPAQKKELLDGVDFVTFTSASTVNSFVARFSKNDLKQIFKTASALSIGPTTTQALRRSKIKNAIQAKQATLESLIQLAQRRV